MLLFVIRRTRQEHTQRAVTHTQSFWKWSLGPQDQGRLLLEEMLPVGLLLPQKKDYLAVSTRDKTKTLPLDTDDAEETEVFSS